jgi:hypothetical protein
MQPSQVLAVGIVGVAALIVFVVLAALNFSRKGSTRTALVAVLLPLAMLPPVLALAIASFQTSNLLSSLATSEGFNGQELSTACRAVWLVPRLAFGLTALLAGAGLLAGLLRFGPVASDARDLSLRRATVLCLLPVLGLGITGVLAHELRDGLGVSLAVLANTKDDAARRSRVERYLDDAGLGHTGSGSIAAISMRITGALQVALIGGGAAVVVLLGLALTGLILAWRVRTGVLFAAASSLLWLAPLAIGALLALGFGAPPVF